MSGLFCRFSLLLILASLVSGCKMCGSPYDYCSPTFSGYGDECCDPMFRAGSLFTDSQYSANGTSVIYNQNTVNTGSGQDCKNCGKGVTRAVPEANGRAAKGNSGWQDGNSRGNNNHNDIGIPPSVPNDDINQTPDGNRFVPPNLPKLDTPLRQELPPSSKINDIVPDVKLSLEELRLEDPSITNVEILGVEELTVPTTPTPAAGVLPNPKSASLFSTQPIE